MTDTTDKALEAAAREVLFEHVKPTLAEVPEGESWFLPDGACIKAMLTFADMRLDEAVKVARGYWVEADYDVVGVADADMAMKLCELAATAIESLKERK